MYCRKVLATSGLMPAPCGVPLSVCCFAALKTPAPSHGPMTRKMRGSAILCPASRLALPVDRRHLCEGAPVAIRLEIDGGGRQVGLDLHVR